MKDLKDIVDEQTEEKPQPDGKYKVLGVVAVLILLYLAIGMVFPYSKFFPLNVIFRPVLNLISDIVFLISNFLRGIWMML